MATPTISIIVPVYNSERYLSRCIDSILAQTFSDFELLLINDGSTDKSGEICDEYASKDKRICVFHKENGGVSSARNEGINHAEGDFLYFVDSDDCLFDNTLSTLLGYAKDDIDMVIAGWEEYDGDTGELKYKVDNRNVSLLSKDQAISCMLTSTDYYYQGYLWTKLFRHSIVNQYHLSFNTNYAFNEDRLFIISYLNYIKGHVIYTLEPVYKYCRLECSAMGSVNSKYNPKFVSDFYAFIDIMHVDSVSNHSVNSKLAKLGFINSYKCILKMMHIFNAYDAKTESLLKRQLFENITLYEWISYRLKNNKMVRGINRIKRFLLISLFIFANLVTLSSCGNGSENEIISPVDSVVNTNPSAKETYRSDVPLADPFILLYNNVYYAYGTGPNCKRGVDCYKSNDLKYW